MFFILRFVRGIIGALFALNAIHVIQGLLNLVMNIDSVFDIGKFFAFLLIKIVFVLITFFLFVWLRKLINNLYEKKYGVPHPSLADKKWNL